MRVVSARETLFLLGFSLIVVGSSAQENATEQCVCDKNLTTTATNACAGATLDGEDSDGGDFFKVYLAGIFDTDNFYWGLEIFNFTVSLLNNHTDGWHDDIFDDGKTVIEFDVANAACDETKAARAYWDLRTSAREVFGLSKVHGVIGARCSGASIAVARIAGLEGVPQVSPVSTASRLSDIEEFPLFSRMVAPDDSRGEVGAVVSLLRALDWDRVTILSTDTQYAKDISTDFRQLWTGEHRDEDGDLKWEGEVAYSNTITLTPSGAVDEDSVRQVLGGVPTDDPTVNSRVILLAAHDEHAYRILEIAEGLDFQPDTVWVGLSWIGVDPPSKSWFPPVPGYLGITPFRNRDAYFRDFERRLIEHQKSNEVSTGKSLFGHYAVPYLVDSIVSLAKALSTVPENERRNGTLVTSTLHGLSLSGVSGEVRFTHEGDRRNPRYTVLNYQPEGWVDVGSIGTTIGSANLSSISGFCFAATGCGSDTAPSDKYPEPGKTAETWVVVVLPLVLLLLIGLALKYWRSREGKKVIKASMTEMQRKMEEMKKIDDRLLDLDQEVETAKLKKNELILQRGALVDKPETWSADTDKVLVEVSPHDDQYWAVADRLRETMDDAHISKLWRVQNTSLWSYYSFHKYRLEMNNVDHNERSVWHGTSCLDPAVIYNDTQDGFMMQYSRDGLWGRGIYFADKGSYSYNYSYRPDCLVDGASSGFFYSSADNKPQSPGERKRGLAGEREMFLAKLLVGSEIDTPQNKSLTVPPVNPKTQLKYNTVTGRTGGSQVWIVYENGRAYPDYLVRYYRGERDPDRTPFKSKKEAMKSKQHAYGDLAPSDDLELGGGGGDSTTSSVSSDGSDGQPAAGGAGAAVVWEYLDDGSVWRCYGDQHQAVIEDAYRAFRTRGPPARPVRITTDMWTYEVDVESMEQVNVEHSNRRRRRIRRRLGNQPAP